MGGASLERLFGDRLFDLNDSVGANRANQRGDVFKVQSLLHREGHLDAEATGGPTGYWGIRDDTAMKGLQKEGSLTVDGWAGPDGETMGYFRDLYRPPQGVQVQASRRTVAAAAAIGDAGADEDYGEAIRNTNRDLAVTLGLDPAKMAIDNPETMRGLSAARFYHHLNRRQQYQAMNDIVRLEKSNPELAGKLRAKIADSIANPIWEIPSMTPERLEQAIRETEQGLKIAKVFDFLVSAGRTGWKLGKPTGAPKIIGRGFGAGGLLSGWMVDGYEKLMQDLKAEQARRSGGP
ncbi:hypothetical protein [Ferrovibrio sp.]|uniref:hypothetical protein n=1 Tax=Ferrovibrio sp. TaxID=1917215 RepID=UPI00262950ED|nr:hypothetical protein [Ferrovibrio sp.]